MASRTNVGLLELTIFALYIKFNVASGSDVVVGVFSQVVQQESWRTFPYEDSGLSSTVGSPNWVVSDSPDKRLFNYREALSIVEQMFRKNFGDLTVSILFREIALGSTVSVAGAMRELVTNQASCDLYVFGLSTHEQRHHETNHQVICEAADSAVSSSNFPSVSWTCPKNGDDSDSKSTLVDVQPPPYLTAVSLMSVLDKFKWRRVALLATSNPEPWAAVCKHVEHALMSSNYYTIEYYESFTDQISKYMYQDKELNTDKFRNTWEAIGSLGVSAVIMCLPHGFGKEYENMTIVDELLWSAYELNEIIAAERAYIVVDPHGLYSGKGFSQWMTRTSEAASKSRRSAIKNGPNYYAESIKIAEVLESTTSADEASTASGTNVEQPSDLGMNSFSSNVHVRRRSVGNETTNSTDPEGSGKPNIYENVLVLSPTLDQSFPEEHLAFVKSRSANTELSYLAYFLDSLYLTLVGISQFARWNSVQNLMDGRRLTNHFIRLENIAGFSGPIRFDKGRLWRVMNYTVWDVLGHDAGNLQITPVMRIDTTVKSNRFYKVIDLNAVKWSSQGVPLQDVCISEVSACQLVPNAINGLSVLVAMISGTGIYFIGYGIVQLIRKKREMKSYLNGPNKIFLDETDLTFISPTSRRMGDGASNMPSSRLGSIVTLADNADVEDITYAIHKGDYVFLKQLCGPLSSELKKQSKDALRQVRDLRHENICSFYGLYSNSSFQFLVMEYGHKRSLKELINNTDFELNWTFKMSLISDLVRGIKYLHSTPIVCHGRLKSRNCIVDGRFVLKVTDYGVNRLRALVDCPAPAKDNPADLLWTAPELLNDQNRNLIGTQKGDSYSFSIICQELILRDEPFCMFNLAPEELIEKLKKPPPLIRPSVSPDAAPIEIIQIMRQCWQEQPDLRLTFSSIYSEIKRMNKGVKHNIVENMMKQLEDYSSHLEELVNERTAELGEEKKKTENLLMRMLPPSVAKLLMANQKIIPECFDNCTIYFSDICGFTTIAHSSTPMQVVDFLNDLYTCFDAIIEQHDVYKVETIGDAYMVSSGIPKVIGERHAEEAALMALDIMSATTTFRVQHLPELDLRIRIGMHSGSAVAGVVGLTMPRYCLFGDTINTASRLETTGIPSRIHISSDTADLLQKSEKKFQLQKRGTIELKGRGTMTTWWLLGLDGFSKPLPNPGKINEPSHGIKLEKPSVNKSANNSKEFEAIIQARRKSILQGDSSFYHNSSGVTFKEEKETTSFRNRVTHSSPSQPNSPITRSGSSFVVATPLALIPPRPEDYFHPETKNRRQLFISNSSAAEEGVSKFRDNRNKPEISGGFVKARRSQLSSLFSRNNKAVAPSPSLLNTVSSDGPE
nr:olfactory guanylyl cyclase GC-D-like [Ciona intestinalis]|eukprot:XP_018671194.2 olfactory guanylyl cyclase GC-D-like [Ciona intestinalis]